MRGDLPPAPARLRDSRRIPHQPADISFLVATHCGVNLPSTRGHAGQIPSGRPPGARPSQSDRGSFAETPLHATHSSSQHSPTRTGTAPESQAGIWLALPPEKDEPCRHGGRSDFFKYSITCPRSHSEGQSRHQEGDVETVVARCSYGPEAAGLRVVLRTGITDLARAFGVSPLGV